MARVEALTIRLVLVEEDRIGDGRAQHVAARGVAANAGEDRREVRRGRVAQPASSIFQISSPTWQPMSTVMRVLPSGASHGMESGASVSRKNGKPRSGRPRHGVAENAAGLEPQADEHHGPVTESRQRRQRVGSSDSFGKNGAGTVLTTAAVHVRSPAARTATARVVFDEICSTGDSISMTSRKVGEQSLDRLRHAALGVDVPDVRAFGRLVAVADGDRPAVERLQSSQINSA